jgi:hypothetical protein
MSTSLRNLWALFILLFLIGVIVFGYTTLKNFGRPDYTITAKGDAVIDQMRALNRLETADFHIEKVIEAGTNGNTFQEFLYGDRILLIAEGDVIAGIDMSKMKDNDFTISGNTIIAKLPAPEIFSSILNNQDTRVFDRKLGLLTKGDATLETKARATAETLIKQAACTRGILNDATLHAHDQLTAFLKALGFASVTVIIPDASCN